MSHFGAGNPSNGRNWTDPGRPTNGHPSHNLSTYQYTEQTSVADHDEEISSRGLFVNEWLHHRLPTDPSDDADIIGEAQSTAENSMWSQGFAYGPHQNWRRDPSGLRNEALEFESPEPFNGTLPNLAPLDPNLEGVGRWAPPNTYNTGVYGANVLPANIAPGTNGHIYLYLGSSDQNAWPSAIVNSCTPRTTFHGFEAQLRAGPSPRRIDALLHRVTAPELPPRIGSANMGHPVSCSRSIASTESSSLVTEGRFHVCQFCIARDPTKKWTKKQDLRRHLVSSIHLNITFRCLLPGCNYRALGNIDNLRKHATDDGCPMHEVKMVIKHYRQNLRGVVEDNVKLETDQKQAEFHAFLRTYDS